MNSIAALIFDYKEKCIMVMEIFFVLRITEKLQKGESYEF